MAKTLIRPVYQNLLNEISTIFVDSKLQARSELNKILTKAYWQIGQRIVTVEQDNEFRAQYGEGLLNRLSEELTNLHGDGFSETNLRYMRQFFHAYPKHQPADELEWTKQCVLLSVSNERKRLKYRDLTISESWSRAKLIETLKSEKLLPATAGKPEQPATSNQQRLSVHRGQPYTYRAAPGNSGYVYIDVGFSITRQIRSWAPVEQGEIIQSRKSADGFELSKSRALPKDLYTYKAYLDRVIDGDTLKLHIDLGFDTFIKETVRLRGIDTPEVKTHSGERARRYVSKALKETKEIIVKTYWEDKFGRYLVDVWLDDRYLNQRLLDEGHAVTY